MKAALYLRVSTKEQTVANQLGDLRRLAESRGWEPVVYEETESAVKKRPVFDRLMADAHRGEIGVVCIVALDRLGRSMLGVVQTVLALDHYRCEVVSLREPWLAAGGPSRQLLLAIFGWFAEEERRVLIQRTRAGIDRARAQGKRLGRPPVSSVLLLGAAERVEERGMSVSAACEEMGVTETTLRRALARRRALRTALARPDQPPSAKKPS